jgi:molybdenum ABC transporter molybdate-binding protein
MTGHKVLWAMVLVLWFLPGSVGRACQVPVFRYALERWRAAPYEVVIFHRGDLAGADRKAVELLAEGEQSLVNIAVKRVDVGGKMSEAHQKLWEGQKNAALPWMVVQFPFADENIPPAWAGSLSEGAARMVMDSPARRELARRILSGESAVWVVLKSGDKAKDDAAVKAVDEKIKEFEKTMKLPDLGAGNPDDAKVLSELPLKLAFSWIGVSRNDPAERMLVNMLLDSSPDLRKENEAMAFPIFGRGRVLGALVGEEMMGRRMREAAEFICGPCSCQVKDLNPGFDLLLAGDWEAVLEGRKAEEAAFALPAGAGAAQAGAGAPSKGEGKWTWAAVVGALVVVVVVWIGMKVAKRGGLVSRPGECRPESLHHKEADADKNVRGRQECLPHQRNGSAGASPSHQRSGRIGVGWMMFLASAAVLAGMVGWLAWEPEPEKRGAEPLRVYCAAGIKGPVEAAALEYEKEYGVKVELEYGGSQTLLARLELGGKGDLYIPADDSFVALARDKKLIAETMPLATMRPVLGVRKGNPKHIRSLEDALGAEVKLAQTNPDAAAVGKVTREALRKAGQWERVDQRTTVYKPTVNDVANDLKIGTVDAGIVWDVTVRQYPELEGVEVAEFAGLEGHVTVAVLHSAPRAVEALRLARYLGARDKGLKHFQGAGFGVAEGDEWSARPVLHLLAGAMLRPAIEQTITAFEMREGVEIRRVYNGCGILVAQMKAGERPDAYFSCDTSFMVQVKDLFLDTHDISGNPMVMLMQKGNPKGIKTLADLGREGMKVGLGHEQQSALGALTRRVLMDGGVYEAVRKNVAVESPTGDLLVNQLRAGSLDAAIVYISNAAASKEKLDVVGIDMASARAVQPIAVGRESQHKQLAGRLMAAIMSVESKERFESQGFQWKVPAGQ